MRVLPETAPYSPVAWFGNSFMAARQVLFFSALGAENFKMRVLPETVPYSPVAWFGNSFMAVSASFLFWGFRS